MGENICNIQIVHVPKYQKSKQPNQKMIKIGLLWWLSGEESACLNAGDMGLIPDLGRSHMPRSN